MGVKVNTRESKHEIHYPQFMYTRVCIKVVKRVVKFDIWIFHKGICSFFFGRLTG